MALIDVSGLTKELKVFRHRPGLAGATFNMFRRQAGTVRALDSVSLSIERGEMIGYVGPNGAGKSTTIKILTGILCPTSGQVSVFGHEPWKHRVENARRIGVIFGQRSQLMWDIPPVESFSLAKELYRIPDDLYRKNLDQFVDILDLGSFMDRPVRELSLGQKMRCELAAAFLHSPEVVYLDEPTIGLDVVVKERIREFLRQVNRERGVTVILATHDMHDVERVCRRLLILDKGHIVWDGSIEEIKRRFGGECTLSIELERRPRAFTVPESCRLLTDEGLNKTLQFHRRDASPAKVIRQIAVRYPLRDLSLKESDVEEIVRSIYQHKHVLDTPAVVEKTARSPRASRPKVR